MEDEERIGCSIFQKHEAVIKRLTDDINRTKELKGKVAHAERLLNEVNTLLDCSDYKKGSPDCDNCHFIANLRRETANVIIKAKKLAR